MSRSVAPVRSATSILHAVLALVSVLGLPAEAGAQWYAAAYLGGNYTHPATVEISQPSRDTALDFDDVRFTAEPLKSPQYYGIRIGRLIGDARRLQLEVEFIHLKTIADTGRAYPVRGTLDGAAVDETSPMAPLVTRYSMTHGLNFLVVNVGMRRPVGPRVIFSARAGAGPTLPHTETTVRGESRFLYEYAGLGVHAAAGTDIRLWGSWSALAEYKLTFARPDISIADGAGQTSTLTHHVAVGLAFGLTR